MTETVLMKETTKIAKKKQALKVAEQSFQVPMPNSPLSTIYAWAPFFARVKVTTEGFILTFWLTCVLLPWQQGCLKTSKG